MKLKLQIAIISLSILFPMSGVMAEETVSGSFSVAKPSTTKGVKDWDDKIYVTQNVQKCIQDNQFTDYFDSTFASAQGNSEATYKVGTDAGAPFAACNTEDSEWTLHFKNSSGGDDIGYVEFYSDSSGNNSWKIKNCIHYQGYTISCPTSTQPLSGADEGFNINFNHE